jgi:hypothetical protein
MQMDNSDEQEAKASDSMRQSLPGESNVTLLRDVQSQKHLEQRTLTRFGMQIDESDVQ